MFKLFSIFEAILTDSLKMITGFRLSDWEIGQLLLIELQTFDRLSKNSRTDDSLYRYKTSALRLLAWSHELGFVHFTRGMKCLIMRHPNSAQLFHLALTELKKGIPLEFDEGQYLDHRYILTRSPLFLRSLPKFVSPKEIKVKSTLYGDTTQFN